MNFAANAGYIVFKDRKTVVFYTNNLAGTPSQRVLTQDSEEAVRLCRGLAPIRRWTGEQNLHRTTFQVPAFIVAYNLLMNGVDRVDQLRSTNPIRRKETRLSMNTLTWAMDMALINAFCIFNKVSGSACKRVTLREFKRRVAEQLTLPQRVRMERKRRPTPPAETLQEIVGMDTSVHTITPNSTKFSKGKLVCYLCTLRGLSKKARYGCTGCNRGFHVTCWTAFHFQHAFTSTSLSVREALDAVCAAASGDAVVQPRLKNNKTITTLDQLELIAD